MAACAFRAMERRQRRCDGGLEGEGEGVRPARVLIASRLGFARGWHVLRMMVMSGVRAIGTRGIHLGHGQVRARKVQEGADRSTGPRRSRAHH